MAGASITVRNSGGYVARFSVSYMLGGSHHTAESGNFTLGFNRTVPVPDGATDIQLLVEEYVFFGATSTVFTKTFSAPVSKYFKIWGTTLSPSWCETNANFDCLTHAVCTGLRAMAPSDAVALVTDSGAAVPSTGGADRTVSAAEFAAAGGHGIEGCIALFAGLTLCYDVQLSPPSVDLSLQMLGIKLAHLELSAANPRATLKGDYGLVSWDLVLALDLAGRKITLGGKVCTFGSCKQFNLTVISW